MVRNKHNPPGIVKFSFWRMAAENPKAVYVCINLGEACAPKDIEERSVCINEDIKKQRIQCQFAIDVHFEVQETTIHALRAESQPSRAPATSIGRLSRI